MSTHSNPAVVTPISRRQLSQRYQSQPGGAGRMFLVLGVTIFVFGAALVAALMI